jgi:very-short-patch-repair endonuclease
MELTAKFLSELQKRLKIGNRKGVHLNAIPGRSNYKFDLSRLSFIDKSLPDQFIKGLLSEQPLKFRITWKNNVPDLNMLLEEDQMQLVRISKSFENLINQTETIESEKGINTFGFGFPILIRRDLADNQLIVSPVLIWSLRVRRTKEFNTWEINRTEDDPIYINEVLINHLLNDAKIEIRQLSEEMLDDGLIDSKELVEICTGLLDSINTSNSPDLSKVLTEKLGTVIPIKEKKYYETLPITPYNALLEFGGLFSIFEVQKQNIISDYDHLMGLEGCVINEDDLKDNQFQPLSSVDTDPSQQGILNALGTKRNVVIQGPPGTGKSQSLTAVLVNALENKKKTIVVCEKRTALEVLEKALVSRGLHYNCVLIKDIVKDRRIAVESVRDRIDNHPSGYRSYNHQYSKETLDDITGKSARLIDSINTKHRLLGRELLSNRDWTMLVGELLRDKRKSSEAYQLQYDQSNFEYNGNELSRYVELIQKGQKLWEAYSPHKHLSFLNAHKLHGTNPFKVEQEIRADYSFYQKQLQGFLKLTHKYKQFYQAQRQNELKSQFETVRELKQLKIKLNRFKSKAIAFKDAFSRSRSLEITLYLKNLNNSLETIEQHVQAHGKEKYYQDELQTATSTYRLSILFSKKRKQTLQHQKELQQLLKNLEILSQTGRGIAIFRYSGQLTGDLNDCRKLKEQIPMLQSDLDGLINGEFETLDLLCPVPEAYQNDFTEDLLNQARELQKQLPLAGTSQQLFKEALEYITKTLNDCQDLDLSISAKEASATLDSIIEDLYLVTHPEKTAEEFALLNLLDPAAIAYSSDYTSLLIDNCIETNRKFQKDNWSLKTLDLKSYQSYLKSLETILDEKDCYFNQIVDVFTAEFSWFNYYNNLANEQRALIDELKGKKDWKRTFQIYYLNSLLVYAADGDMPVDDQEHNELRGSLSEIEKEQIRFIKEYWYSNQIKETRQFEHTHPNLSIENLYNKRSSQRFKRLSLRQIVQYEPDLFTSFFPIILTTPDVCSNLFKGMKGYFDIVVFDEASQLRLEDNLPAVLKGKQVVVAGDEHQMPPSNYFSKIFEGVVEDEEDLEEEVEFKIDKNDLLLSCESLLDFANELGFEKRYLDFHYRSRHPYLIDFSNYAFYKQRLKPLPNNFNYTPIRYIPVGGTFSEHTNEREAETVLSILEHQIHRLPDGQYPSVGIATFNIAQRNLIKGKLLERQKFEKYNGFNAKMVEIENNGFFIKNLENIQGDERDIIIISTTYGINKDGKFMQRFGPITQSKGYKLLNVIITRAKFKVFVCSSIPEEVFLNYRDQLVTEGSNNKRAVFFAYMAYAKSVSDNDHEARMSILQALAENSNTAKNYDSYNSDLESPFEEEVYAALSDHFDPGHIVPQLQFAGFRIDLVFDTKIPGKPRIAIECDGSNYHSSQEAYLHDLYRQKILENHGFIFHRIWSTNWWRNSKREIDRLVTFIREVLESQTPLLPQQEELALTFQDNLNELMKAPVDIYQEISSHEEALSVKGSPAIQSSLFEDNVGKGSYVALKYLNTNKTIKVRIVSGRDKLGDRGDGIHRISVDAPLGKSLMGSVKGDIVKIGDLDNYVEVLSVNSAA